MSLTSLHEPGCMCLCLCLHVRVASEICVCLMSVRSVCVCFHVRLCMSYVTVIRGVVFVVCGDRKSVV